MLKPAVFLAGLFALLFFSPGLKNNLDLLIEKQSLPKPNTANLNRNVQGAKTTQLSSDAEYIKYPQDYTIVLLGDSMTEYLGNADELTAYLQEKVPNKTFQFLNYGFGSTNILSSQDRLEKETIYQRSFSPILDIDFDIILIESFGHNPLTHLSLNEGLQKQSEALEKLVSTIKSTHPKAKIVFVATIAPNKKTYAKGVNKLTATQILQWVEDRNAYIKNHITFANNNNIPLINIYKKSLDENGSGKSIYINTIDNIHPSPTGVLLISKEISDFLTKYNLVSPD